MKTRGSLSQKVNPKLCRVKYGTACHKWETFSIALKFKNGTNDFSNRCDFLGELRLETFGQCGSLTYVTDNPTAQA